MTADAQQLTEVSSSWTRDYAVDGMEGSQAKHPRKDKDPRASADLGQIMPNMLALGFGADTAPFPEVMRLLARSQRWKWLANETLGEAQQELVEAKGRALAVEAPSTAALNEYLATKERLRAYSVFEAMDVERNLPGRERRVILVANELAREEEALAGKKLLTATGDLYAKLATRAAATVAEVQRVLPLLAPNVWSALKPAAVLADEARNVLFRAEADFNRAHYVSRYLRAMGGVDDRLVGDEPHLATVFRNWPVAHIHRHELRGIRDPLKLAFVVRAGWEPGLWTRGDLDTVGQGPGRRRFLTSFLGR
jgi:hypothetical protein